jgi:hypothetical protein
MAREQRHGASSLGGAHDRRTPEHDETYRSDVDLSSESRRAREEHARDRFGGVNLGASFFGWIVAIGIAVLLTSIVGAVGAAVGYNGNVSQSAAERQAGTIGIAAAVVLLVVLMIGYYAGGYVAGRMSRFDGGRQGMAVWLIGLLVTIVAIALGAAFGSQYNLLDRVSLPRVPVSFDQLGWGALATGIAVIVLTLLAAVLGGRVGHRYHDRVDRAVGR